METKILSYLLGDLPVKKTNWEKVNFSRLILKAAQNRVLYPFVQWILKEKKIVFPGSFLFQAKKFFQEGQIKEKKLKKTARVIKKIWDGKVDYYLFKTIQVTGSLPTDLDILFKNRKDYYSAVKIMRAAGWIYQGDNYKGIFFYSGLVPVEPHLTISWENNEFFSGKFLLKNPQKGSFLGIQFKTLGDEAELGIRLAQIYFDCQYLVIRDLLAIVDLLTRVKDLSGIEAESKKYSWFNSLQKSLALVKKAEKKEIELPLWISFLDYFQALSELNNSRFIKNFTFYFWKRGRFFLKKQPSFVDSWLY